MKCARRSCEREVEDPFNLGHKLCKRHRRSGRVLVRDPENWELEFTETGAIMRPASKDAAPVQSELERKLAEARRERIAAEEHVRIAKAENLTLAMLRFQTAARRELALSQELQKQRKEL